MPTIRRRTEPDREIEVSDKELLDFERRGDVLDDTPETSDAPASDDTYEESESS
jgi:hypothetical protein